LRIVFQSGSITISLAISNGVVLFEFGSI